MITSNFSLPKAIGETQCFSLGRMSSASFYYTSQLTFNLRSLVHFLKLRLNRSAHYTIRNVAKEMFNELPEDYKRLLKVVKF